MLSACGGSQGKNMVLRSEEKLVEWMTDRASKFRKAGELVLNTYTAILAAVKACFQLLEHCRFVDLEKYPACFQDALPLLMEVYAKQVITHESDIVGSEEAVKGSELLVKEIATLN